MSRPLHEATLQRLDCEDCEALASLGPLGPFRVKLGRKNAGYMSHKYFQIFPDSWISISSINILDIPLIYQ